MPLGAWRVSRRQPSGAIRGWLEAREATWVEAGGFDELMLLFREEFEIEHPTAEKFEKMIGGYRETACTLELTGRGATRHGAGFRCTEGGAATSPWNRLGLVEGRFPSDAGSERRSRIAPNRFMRPESKSCRITDVRVTTQIPRQIDATTMSVLTRCMSVPARPITGIRLIARTTVGCFSSPTTILKHSS